MNIILSRFCYNILYQVLLKPRAEQNAELNSNQELLEITSEIYNKTDKFSNQFHEYNVTINTADRNTTLNLDTETNVLTAAEETNDVVRKNRDWEQMKGRAVI